MTGYLPLWLEIYFVIGAAMWLFTVALASALDPDLTSHGHLSHPPIPNQLNQQESA